MVVPGVGDQIRMGQVAVLDDAYHNGIPIRSEAAGADVPGAFTIDVMVMPLLAVLRVAAHFAQFQVMIVLCQANILVGASGT